MADPAAIGALLWAWRRSTSMVKESMKGPMQEPMKELLKELKGMAN